MTERNRFYAIVPIHGRNAVVEGKDTDELSTAVNEVLRQPEEVYPFHDFRAEIKVIKGKEIKFTPKK
jgi:hypothetical protein